MKKILTLCLAAICCVTTGVALSGGVPAAKVSADQPAELTRNITEAYTFKGEDMANKTPASNDPASAYPAWKTVLGMTKFSSTFSDADSKFYIGFEAVDASKYEYVSLKALAWAEGGYYAFDDAEIYTAANELAYNTKIARTWADRSCGVYAEAGDVFMIKIPTSALKDENGKVSGLIIKNFVTKDNSGWFMVSDVTFTNDSAEFIGVAGEPGKTNLVADGKTNTLQQFVYSANWKDYGLMNRIAGAGVDKSFVATIGLKKAVKESETSYFKFKFVGWGNAGYTSLTVKNLDGTEVARVGAFYEYSDFSDKLDFYIPAKGLGNADGIIEGFVLASEAGVDHFVFSEVMAYKENAEVMIDLGQSSSTAGVYQKNNWANIDVWNEKGLLYNGKEIANGTLTTVFKLPINASVYKTIDFDALIWDKGGVRKVRIEKLDGTETEIINMTSGSTAEEAVNLGVKINAELLADENGMVGGFKMTIVDESKDAHLVFSEMKGGTTEKEYTTIFRAEGSDDVEKTFTASTFDSVEIPAIPEKEHYVGAWEAPALKFEEGRVVNVVYTPIEYTATFKAGEDVVKAIKYTVENKDEAEVPAVPEKTGYAGKWENYELNFDNAQTINAVYTIVEYTVTFKADGKIVSTVTYTVENKNDVVAPAVPEKEGYSGKWAAYELNFDNAQVVEAEYEKLPGTPDNPGKTESGCGSGIGSASAIMLVVAAAFVLALTLKRKRG